MYAICSVVKNDVLKAVKKMVKKGYNFPVIQFPKRQYKELEQNRQRVPEMVNPTMANGLPHAINTKTGVLHKIECPHHGKHYVEARIVSNPATTGLRVCRHCFE